MDFDLTFTVVALFDDSPQLQQDRHDTCDFAVRFVDLLIYIKPQMNPMNTHKASASITKRRPFICGFLEIVCIIKIVAQLGTYRHSPHEVRGDVFTADLSLPGQKVSKVQHKSE